MSATEGRVYNAVLAGAVSKSLPIVDGPKMSMKFCRPMKLAVSSPVWVDQFWNESQMVAASEAAARRSRRLDAPIEYFGCVGTKGFFSFLVSYV
jgi:hypothetical protein